MKDENDHQDKKVFVNIYKSKSSVTVQRKGDQAVRSLRPWSGRALNWSISAENWKLQEKDAAEVIEIWASPAVRQNTSPEHGRDQRDQAAEQRELRLVRRQARIATLWQFVLHYCDTTQLCVYICNKSWFRDCCLLFPSVQVLLSPLSRLRHLCNWLCCWDLEGSILYDILYCNICQEPRAKERLGGHQHHHCWGKPSKFYIIYTSQSVSQDIPLLGFILSSSSFLI